MKRLTITAVALLFGALVPASEAKANTVVYTSPASYGAATADAKTVGFNGILGTGVSFEAFNPLILSGVTFSTPTPNTNINVTTANLYSPDDYAGDFIVDSANPSANNELVISLTIPTHALALDYGGLGFSGPSSATITLSNGYVFSPASLVSVGQTQFAGIVSSDLITSLTLVTTNDSWVVEDFSTSNPVPEPSTSAMLGGATLIALLLRRSFSKPKNGVAQ